MTEPTLPEQLEAASRAYRKAKQDRRAADQQWRFLEAAVRQRLRATDDSTGQRRSCEDVRADIIIARNDPETAIGQAWIALVAARALEDKLEVDEKVLDSRNWDEIRKARY